MCDQMVVHVSLWLIVVAETSVLKISSRKSVVMCFCKFEWIVPTMIILRPPSSAHHKRITADAITPIC